MKILKVENFKACLPEEFAHFINKNKIKQKDIQKIISYDPYNIILFYWEELSLSKEEVKK